MSYSRTNSEDSLTFHARPHSMEPWKRSTKFIALKCWIQYIKYFTLLTLCVCIIVERKLIVPENDLRIKAIVTKVMRFRYRENGGLDSHYFVSWGGKTLRVFGVGVGVEGFIDGALKELVEGWEWALAFVKTSKWNHIFLLDSWFHTFVFMH